MSNLFNIYEDDLEVLEQNLPVIADFCSLSDSYNERKDIQEILSMLKQIASNVRWNYGPPKQIDKIDGTFPIDNPGES